MDSLHPISLVSNSRIKINLDGGDLSFDAGLHRHHHGNGAVSDNPVLLWQGEMENFIKEGKSGFDFASVSSSSKVVNTNRLQVHALAYNLFNWFRRLALVADMRTQRIDAIRLKLLKIAARVVKSARYKYFKLCSRCPEKTQGIMSGFKLPEDEMLKSYRRV